MQQKPIKINWEHIPECFHSLSNGKIFNSSCSSEATVYFIDLKEGYYLKRSAKGTLLKEAEMTRYFHQKGWSAEVLAYESLEEDWLLTARIPGDDLTAKEYLSEPNRLCDTLAEILRALHALPFSDCPVQNKNDLYYETAKRNHQNGIFDPTLVHSKMSADRAWQYIEEHRSLLQKEAMVHGDFCLPNLLLNQWKFSGLIDLGNAGVGDRHIDLFWAGWSLEYNLKTDRFRNRFFDAYGRDQIDSARMKLIETIECFG